MTPAEVCRVLGVSRETSERLEAYVAFLEEWQPRLNLIGPGTADDIWRRHILDCGQIARHVPRGCRRLLDIGSGAGLPGLVLAIMGVDGVEMVEKDARKVAFLHSAARTCEVDVGIHNSRIEALQSPAADVVTARAVAPLRLLVAMAAPFLGEDSVSIFPKGRSVDEELKDAAREWHMWYQRRASLSDSQGSLLVIDRVHRERRL